MTLDANELAHLLRSSDLNQRCAAAEQLATLGEGAQSAAVALVEACAVDDDARESVVAALEGLGPPAAKDIVALAALLERDSLDEGYWAATLLGRATSEAAPATDALIDALVKHPELSVRERAAWALGKIGPPAKSALGTLGTAAAGPNARLSTLARAAITSIEG